MKKKFSKLDKPLLITTIILFGFGLIMILSASSMEIYMRYGASPYNYFFKQAVFLVVGLIISLIIFSIPTKKYIPFANLIIILSIGSLLLLKLIGYTANNSESWFIIGPFSLQPSEFIKIGLILYMAIYYEKYKDELDNQLTLILPLIFALIIAVLVAFQPDMGTASIIVLLVGILFYAIPMKKEYRGILNKMIIGGILIVVGVIVTTGGSFLRGYQLERLNFIDPCSRYQDRTGYQVCNGFIAFNNGGLTGKGLGGSTQKYLYLPESYTDFIFPIIVEEWGFIVGLIVILCFAFVIYRILNIARRTTVLRNSILAYGVAIYIFLHVIINLFGVMGLAPLTGVPLPFLSYGGSFTLSLFIGLAFVQRVEIENNKQKKLKKTKS